MACEIEQAAADEALNQEAAAWGILCVKYMEVSAAYDAYFAAMQAREEADNNLSYCVTNSGG